MHTCNLVLNLLNSKCLRLFKVSFRYSFVNKMADETRNPETGPIQKITDWHDVTRLGQWEHVISPELACAM